MNFDWNIDQREKRKMTKQFGLMREKEPIRVNKGGQDANKGKQSTIIKDLMCILSSLNVRMGPHKNNYSK